MNGRAATALAMTLLLLTACGGSDRPRTDPPVRTYAALGDSFVSGPGILPHVASSGACGRSEHDYAHELADLVDVDELVDVSCGGAVTDHVLDPFGTLPAQLDAVSADTDLVTVGIGGNDGRYYEGYFNSCLFAQYRTPSGCRTFADVQGPQILAETGPKITRVLEAVQARAPGARVVLVGYLRILPASGSCPVMSIAAPDVANADRSQRALETMQRDAARAAGVDFLSVRAVSEGHDACDDDRWVNDLQNTATDGIYLHPNRDGMTAVAGALADLLEAR